MASARAAAGTPSQRVRMPRKTQSGGEEGEEGEGGDGEDRLAAEPGASPLAEGLEEAPGLAEVEEAREEARAGEGDGEGGERKACASASGFPAPRPSQAIRPKPRPERVVKAMIEGAGCMR